MHFTQVKCKAPHFIALPFLILLPHCTQECSATTLQEFLIDSPPTFNNKINIMHALHCTTLSPYHTQLSDKQAGYNLPRAYPPTLLSTSLLTTYLPTDYTYPSSLLASPPLISTAAAATHANMISGPGSMLGSQENKPPQESRWYGTQITTRHRISLVV